MEAKNSYKILVVTDTHDDIEKVKALVNKVQHIKFDFIFCCGDIVSVPIDKNADKENVDISYYRQKYQDRFR